MQNDMRDRLVELIKQGKKEFTKSDITYIETYLADYLIAKGVIVLDMNVISPENRPLITQFANTPLDELFNLIKADVVPVVRCKDCKHYRDSTQAKGIKKCAYSSTNETDFLVMPDDFCNYGEREDNENT